MNNIINKIIYTYICIENYAHIHICIETTNKRQTTNDNKLFANHY